MIGSQTLVPLVAAFRERVGGRRQRRRPSPVQAVALSFITIIAVGAALLALPVSHQPGVTVSVLDTVFTATSATCVTGLVTVSTADTWSTFGHIVILAMIQIGGLGYMTVATIVALLLGVRVGLRTRLQLMEAHGALSLKDAITVVRYVALGTAIIESIGAIILAFFFHFRHGMPWGSAIWNGVFHSISAFCNAGFDLFPGFLGLAAPVARTDIALLLAISVLVILGGLGFGVLAEMVMLPSIKRLSLHAKVVMATTAVLLVVGMLLFIFFEGRNPYTLGDLTGPWERITTAWFMAVTPRTAGFSPVDLTAVTPPTLFIIGMLMIVGASPDSTGGGVKTTTVALIILAITALVRQKRDIEVFKRRISGELIRLSLSLVSVYLLAVLLVVIGISFAEIILPGVPPGDQSMSLFGRLTFEVLSAFGTVGLSAGITPTLGPISKALLILGMYLGRLGPLAFVFIFAAPHRTPLRRLPSEPLMMGG